MQTATLQNIDATASGAPQSECPEAGAAVRARLIDSRLIRPFTRLKARTLDGSGLRLDAAGHEVVALDLVSVHGLEVARLLPELDPRIAAVLSLDDAEIADRLERHRARVRRARRGSKHVPSGELAAHFGESRGTTIRAASGGRHHRT